MRLSSGVAQHPYLTGFVFGTQIQSRILTLLNLTHPGISVTISVTNPNAVGLPGADDREGRYVSAGGVVVGNEQRAAQKASWIGAVLREPIG